MLVGATSPDQEAHSHTTYVHIAAMNPILTTPDIHISPCRIQIKREGERDWAEGWGEKWSRPHTTHQADIWYNNCHVIYAEFKAPPPLPVAWSCTTITPQPFNHRTDIVRHMYHQKQFLQEPAKKIQDLKLLPSLFRQFDEFPIRRLGEQSFAQS